MTENVISLLLNEQRVSKRLHTAKSGKSRTVSARRNWGSTDDSLSCSYDRCCTIHHCVQPLTAICVADKIREYNDRILKHLTTQKYSEILSATYANALFFQLKENISELLPTSMWIYGRLWTLFSTLRQWKQGFDANKKGKTAKIHNWSVLNAYHSSGVVG